MTGLAHNPGSDTFENKLDAALATGRPVLTCYYPAGDPRTPIELLDIYAQCGVDVVELGLPTANPFMDGTAVRAAMARASKAPDIFEALVMAAGYIHRLDEGPAAICMTYADIDVATFLQRNILSVLDGLLMLGLEQMPERHDILSALRESRTRLVKFVNWELDHASVTAAHDSDSYLMLQAAPGATGARAELDRRNAAHIKRIRAYGLVQPVLLGFGISTPQQAHEAVAMGANGVVIGSMCLEKAWQGPEALRDFLGAVREAMDA